MCSVNVYAQADEAYCIGPPPSSESYLRQDKIMEVALASGAKVGILKMITCLSLFICLLIYLHNVTYLTGYSPRVWVPFRKQEFC